MVVELMENGFEVVEVWTFRDFVRVTPSVIIRVGNDSPP